MLSVFALLLITAVYENKVKNKIESAVKEIQSKLILGCECSLGHTRVMLTDEEITTGISHYQSYIIIIVIAAFIATDSMLVYKSTQSYRKVCEFFLKDAERLKNKLLLTKEKKTEKRIDVNLLARTKDT